MKFLSALPTAGTHAFQGQQEAEIKPLSLMILTLTPSKYLL